MLAVMQLKMARRLHATEDRELMQALNARDSLHVEVRKVIVISCMPTPSDR
jgi:hypothetical protein